MTEPRPSTAGAEDPAFYEALGRAIKVARAQQDLSRKDLAQAADLSYAYLSDIETGRGRPSSRALIALAEALGKPTHTLLEEADVYLQQLRGGSWPVEQLAGTLARAGHVEREVVGSRRPADPRTELANLVADLSPADVQLALELLRRLTDGSTRTTTV